MAQFVFDRTLAPQSDLNKHGVPNWFAGWDEVQKFSEEKCALVKSLQFPAGTGGKTLAEIGVRYGYGTFGLIKALYPEVKYVGIDKEDFSTSVKRLQDRFPKAQTEFRLLDTLKTDRLNVHADLVHVDAGLSEAEVLRNLDLAWECLKPGGWIIVNNYTFVFKRNNTASAVNDFIKEKLSEISSHELHKTLRGDYAIQKRG